MDAVKAFNAEMASMLDMKPPISRAKMMLITKAGMKAIKLYKHVVQIIEKFISKCNPELKVPGLYVMDSIIRQSRIQFGEEKDLFGPRFLKNMTVTFQSLYQCPPDDKEKILRVLSLWQKNSMFSMDIIQPLVDMASAPVMPVLEDIVPAVSTPEASETHEPQNSAVQLQNEAALAAIAQFLQSTEGLDLQQILRTVQQSSASQPSTVLKAQHDEELEMEELPSELITTSSINFQDLQHANLLNHHLSQAEFGHSNSVSRDTRYSRTSRSRSPRRCSPSCSDSYSLHHYRRSHSGSRERWRNSQRPRREDKKEADRRRKGLPPIKRETLSVCSTTLWLGQLDKKIQQQDVSGVMEEFGQVESINMIPPRGCAYIVLLHRQDAYTALNKLSRGSARINHKPFKIAWAMNKGVSSRYKKYWDVDLGVTYIPWEKLRETEIAALREGAVLDQDTLKPEWAALLDKLNKPATDTGEGPEREQDSGAALSSQVSPVITESSVKFTNTSPADQVTPPSENTEPAQKLTESGTVKDPHPSLMPLVSNNIPPLILLPSSLSPTHLTPPSVSSNDMTPPSVPFAKLLPASKPRPSLPCPSFSRPNLPRPSLPPPILPRHNLPRPNLPRGPMFRFRMPMPGPKGKGFLPPGPLEAEHWNGGDLRNDWPIRGPEWFGPEPPFRPGVWNRGGPRGRPQFRN